MKTILLTTDGRIVSAGQDITGSPLISLAKQVELQEGWTLRSFFLLLTNAPQLQELNEFFTDFMVQYQDSPEQDCVLPGVDRLELGKVVEMVGFPGEPKLEVYTSLYAVTGDTRSELPSSHLELILDMNIRLGNLRHVVFGDKVDVFEFETVFTLFECIDGIAWELGFHGTPKECQLRR